MELNLGFKIKLKEKKENLRWPDGFNPYTSTINKNCFVGTFFTYPKNLITPENYLPKIQFMHINNEIPLFIHYISNSEGLKKYFMTNIDNKEIKIKEDLLNNKGVELFLCKNYSVNNNVLILENSDLNISNIGWFLI